jgi:Ca2+-transporting ATPase
MTEHQVGELLLDLALLFALTYLLAGLLERVHIPGILAALFVAMAVHYTPLGERLLTPEFHVPLSFLAELGVLFLLFYIGLQIDLEEMRNSGRDILLLTFLNTIVPFLFGMVVMLTLGYGWMLAFIIGLTRMPTAEAVIVPILDEFKLIRTKVGAFIIGAGVLDDVIEVVLVAIVSVWIGAKAGETTGGIGGIISGILVFMFLAWLIHRWLLPLSSKWMSCRPRNLMLLSIVVLFGFGGLSEYADLGMIVGAITAGVLLRPILDTMGEVGEQLTKNVQSISYGFLGLLFFFWVGLNTDLGGLLREPVLAILLYLAGTVGKIVGVFIMVPLKKITVREAWIIGIGLDARLTTEIIVAQLLFSAGIINGHLYTALISAASFTAITVPLVFALLVRQWGEQLRTSKNNPAEETST